MPCGVLQCTIPLWALTDDVAIADALTGRLEQPRNCGGDRTGPKEAKDSDVPEWSNEDQQQERTEGPSLSPVGISSLQGG